MYKKIESCAGALLVAASLLCSMSAVAEDLTVCAGKNEMPFSNQAKEGFENEIAKVLAKELNRNLNYYWWDNAIKLGRFLSEDKCDVVIGTDPRDPRILATKPYYKSAYVFVTRKDREIPIDSWDHPFLKERNFRIGFIPDTPGEIMLIEIGRFDDMFDYLADISKYKSTRSKYIHFPPSRLVNDVESMKLEAAVLWGPEAARYVRAEPDLKMVAIEDSAKKRNGEEVPMHYEIVMGVGKKNTELRDAINQIIDKKPEVFLDVLEKEGIPLVSLK